MQEWTVNDMWLRDIITVRKNKFEKDRKNPSFSDFWQGYHEGWYSAYRDLEEIMEQHTIEAIPVVRCRECKHWGIEHTTPVLKSKCPCVVVDRVTRPDDFCSYGERKDGEG